MSGVNHFDDFGTFGFSEQTANPTPKFRQHAFSPKVWGCFLSFLYLYLSMITLFRARVSSVEDIIVGDTREGRKQIYVEPIGYANNATTQQKVYPPNFMPNSVAGSGVWSWPDVGQECIVAVDDQYEEGFIISYTVFPGMDIFGDYIEAETGEMGGVVLKVGGYESAKVAMSPGGIIDIGSNRFSRISIDGTQRFIEIQSMPMRIDFAGGTFVFNYGKEHIDTGIKEITSNVIEFARTYEEPGFSDWEQLCAERTIEIPPLVDYVDKCVIRAGYIPNFNKTTDTPKHVFQLDTRQSIGDDPKLKDVTTELKLGYQYESDVYGNGVVYPEGSILEWKAKRNVADDIGTAYIRYGKLKTGDYSGEVYRIQLRENIDPGTGSSTLGTNVAGYRYFDSTGFGKGFDYVDNLKVGEQYVLSVGTLSDNTLFREQYYNDIDSYNYIFGGDVISSEVIRSVNVYKSEILDKQSYVVSHQTPGKVNTLAFRPDEVLLKHHVDDIVDVSMLLDNHDLALARIANKEKEREQIYLTDQEIYIEYYTDEDSDFIDIQKDDIEFENRTTSNIRLHEETISAKSGGHPDVDNLVIDGDKLSLTHGTSGIVIETGKVTITAGTSYVEVADDKITINALGSNELILSSTGFTLNGVAFAMETLVAWLNTYSTMLGMGNLGAPVPMFPVAKTAFQIGNLLEYPVLGAFKS